VYRPKKSKVFTREDLEKFLDSALDEKYLLLKIVFIMGVAGGCRISELCKMSIGDVEDRGNVLVVQVPDTKTYKQRTFTVVNGNNSVHAIEVYHKCRKLRPENVTHKRLFLNYQRKKCTVQPVGLKMFSKMPEKIATFLSLSNPKEYTGHSFRRSSATLQLDQNSLAYEMRTRGNKRVSVRQGYAYGCRYGTLNEANLLKTARTCCSLEA
jgi:integrase